jgi:hypothetical protein
MGNIIRMADPESVREVGRMLGRLTDKIVTAQSEIRTGAAGMDWSQKDDFVNEVTSWAWKTDSLAHDCNLLARKVAQEADEWEAAAAAFGWGSGGNTPFLWGDGDSSAADESDIRQGNIGDCFLMSSMGAIALTHPELLEDMIEVLPDGRYKVRFYDKKCDGIFGPCHYEEHYVIVDGNFGNEHANPADNQGGTQEIWTLIIEKAYLQWQKENGMNPLTDLPSPAVALSAMTGKDCVNYCMPQVGMDELYESFKRGDAITAGSRWETDQTRPHEYFNQDVPKNKQIVEGHVYIITDVNPLNGTVTVQNPWGGDWPPITMPFEDYQKCFWLTTTNPVE